MPTPSIISPGGLSHHSHQPTHVPLIRNPLLRGLDDDRAHSQIPLCSATPTGANIVSSLLFCCGKDVAKDEGMQLGQLSRLVGYCLSMLDVRIKIPARMTKA